MIQTQQKKDKPIIYDPLIITRVKQYLEENVHQTYVDVSVMAKKLQERYREYSRRKSGPFRVLVEQAYKTVLHSYGLDSNPSSDENTGAGGNSDLEDNSSSNHMNDMLTNLYSKSPKKDKTLAPNENEAIDISSDESGDDDNGANGKTKKRTNNNIPEEGAKKQIVYSFGPEDIIQPHKKRKIIELDVPKMPPLTNAVHHLAGGDAGFLLPGGARAKRYKKAILVKQAQYSFRDIGGMDRVLKELCELLYHVKRPEIYLEIGLSPPRGFLLHGPPGCGKTLLAQAIAGQLSVGFIEVPATEIIAGVSGESEERIREIFEQAACCAPCVLFIDEIDAISSNRQNAQKDMERRVVAQLISSLDGLSRHENGDQIVVIGATNRPEVLDPALRRVGRFDHEIALGVPDRKEREEILIVISETLTLQHPFDYRKVAELTPGYVGADLMALATRAASLAVKRKYFHQLNRFCATKLRKNILIVDLLEETANDNDGKEKESSGQTKKDTENSEKKDESPNKNKESDTGKEKSTEPETPEGDNSSLPNAAATPGEKMDVDTTEATPAKVPDVTSTPGKKIPVVDSTKTSPPKNPDINGKISEDAKKDEPIDVDELSDDEQSFEMRKEPSLTELLAWLNADTPPLQDSQLTDLYVTLDDFKEAIKLVKPSAKREGFITVPDITWDDIGSLHNIREELQLAIVAPVKYPERLNALGLNAPSGVLLCGPPGCGKTLLAKAIANEAGINFISVKGPELMNMYVGESERAVRQCFQRARNSAPCVIFFDEFDSLCPKRSESAEGGGGTRVVNQLLTEMDGIEDRKGVFLMAATNRPDIIDPAVLRPGRLDTVLYVGLPETRDREEILDAITKKGCQPVLADNVDLHEISEITEGYTGADLSGLVRQASFLALKESMGDPHVKVEDLKVTQEHLLQALKMTKPSVSEEDREVYEQLREKFAAPRGADKESEIIL